MESLACGEIGLTIDQFYNLTPAQFYNIQKGYFKKQEQLFENDWMQTKVLSWMIYNTIPSKTKKQSFEKFANTFFNAKEELVPAIDYDKEAQALRAKEMFKKIDLKNQ